jgi:hypothetical protein
VERVAAHMLAQEGVSGTLICCLGLRVCNNTGCVAVHERVAAHMLAQEGVSGWGHFSAVTRVEGSHTLCCGE